MLLKLFNPSSIVKIESALIALISLGVFIALQQSWVVFVLAVVAIDLTMLGYWRNVRWGMVTYNLGHTYVLPLILAAYAILINSPLLFSVSLGWIFHIAIDRTLGFDLKNAADKVFTSIKELPDTTQGQIQSVPKPLQSATAQRKKIKQKKKSQVLNYVRQHGVITNNIAEKVAKVSDATATRYLDELTHEGLLVSEGEGRGVHYKLHPDQTR